MEQILNEYKSWEFYYLIKNMFLLHTLMGNSRLKGLINSLYILYLAQGTKPKT